MTYFRRLVNKLSSPLVFYKLGQFNLLQSDWGGRILHAAYKGEFSQFDMRAAREWPTCACGRLDERIDRFTNRQSVMFGAPVDVELRLLGQLFYDFVLDNRVALALSTLLKIDIRETEVLNKYYETNMSGGR